MTVLIITRGLPGSGKTTIAERLVESAGGRMARINRDDLRTMMHGRRLGVGWQEQQVTTAQHAAVAALLRSGVDVIADDTNLPDRDVETWRQLAAECGATLEVIDLRDAVPLETCIARDADRGARGGRLVGEKAIRAMHAAGQRVLAPPT
ncbi:AAA family ATPase [Micromonospora haikouensis]|uniref:AAA family ATPase n=1 Tax=Actinomycetes TaxID=1760 RepID=UPI003406F9AD